MRLRTLGLTLACSLAALGSASSFAQQSSAGQGSAAQPTEIASLAALPAEIRTALGADISDRGGPFAAGCVSLHGEPHSCFHAARISGNTAQVTLERGGIAHFFDQIEFRVVGGHWVRLPGSSIPKAPPAPPAGT